MSDCGEQYRKTEMGFGRYWIQDFMKGGKVELSIGVSPVVMLLLFYFLSVISSHYTAFQRTSSHLVSVKMTRTPLVQYLGFFTSK